MGDKMFILESSACTSANVLATVLFFKKLIEIMCIIVPIILVLLVSIDFAKAVIANDENQMKKAQSLAIRRMIYGVVIFFVPTIVTATFGLIEGQDVTKSCFGNATDEVVTALKQIEDEKLELREGELEELIEAARENQLALDAKFEEIRNQAGSSSNIPSGSTDDSVSAVASKILASADKIAHGLETNHFKYVYSSKYKSYTAAVKAGYRKTNCAQYVVWTYIDAGVMAPGNSFFFKKGKYGSASSKKTLKKLENAGRIKIYYGVNKKLKTLIESGQVKPGDALANIDQTHTFIYAGKKNGTYTFYTVGTNGKDGFKYNEVYRTDLHTKYGNKTIVTVIRPLKAS